jgi:hypothetical protein
VCHVLALEAQDKLLPALVLETKLRRELLVDLEEFPAGPANLPHVNCDVQITWTRPDPEDPPAVRIPARPQRIMRLAPRFSAIDRLPPSIIFLS